MEQLAIYYLRNLRNLRAAHLVRFLSAWSVDIAETVPNKTFAVTWTLGIEFPPGEEFEDWVPPPLDIDEEDEEVDELPGRDDILSDSWSKNFEKLLKFWRLKRIVE